MKPLLPFCATLLAFPFVALHAQETTAGGNLQTEASWNALQSLITRTQNNLDIVSIDVAAIQKCNNQKKLYSKTTGQCQDIIDTRVDEIVKCGKSNKVWSETKGCVEVTGANRWFFLKNGPSIESSFNASHAQRMVMDALEKDGVIACTSGMTEGRKCSIVGQRCAHFSDTNYTRGKQNEQTYYRVSSSIIKCD